MEKGENMKLKNKQTGEIATLTLSSNGEELLLMKNSEMVTRNVKLLDLKEWEDYEEPEEYWYIDDAGVIQIDQVLSSEINMRKSIGNYFETKEEAEKAVEKLKAFKRLKDKGFRFTGITPNRRYIKYNYGEILSKHGICYDKAIQFEDDLDFLFGGEE